MLPSRLATALTTAACSIGLVALSATALTGPAAATTTSTTSTSTTQRTTVSGHGMPAGGVFTAGTGWKLDVRNAPLHPNSAGMVANVAAQTAAQYSGVAAFNAYQYSTSFYTVPADQPKVDVRWTNCQGKSSVPDFLLGPGGHFTQVPIPSRAVPAKGTDSQLTVWSPDTDQLWEFWMAKKVDGVWSACWGGRIDGLSKNNGYFPQHFGASASGLALAGGTVGIKDVQSGVIDHALALHLQAPGTASEWSYPAQRSDGFDTSANRVPEGTRLRLDPSVDVDALPMHPIAKMVAKAVQKYGFIVTDRAGCTAVVAESPEASINATGVDPWKALMGSTPSYSIMKGFPWEKLQALPKDWAEPAPTAPVGPSGPVDTTGMDVRYASDTAYRVNRNGWGPVEKDRSNGGQAAGDGRTLTIAGTTYAKGLGVHAASEVVVPVGTATVFTTQVGVDASVGLKGSVVFQVWRGTTKIADSGLVRGGEPARTLTVDVTGAGEIRLVVTHGGDNNYDDHADWADAKLLTKLPTSGTGSTATTGSTGPSAT
ncbi:NPCBM/NEW2 domain-containing protein [Kineococcus terrestris]|uniref:NPCBM/NEW2 domain-containing protein n=1 Tax=Kineococcus terrestris TaxID=2044856 RepID=UPI0034DB6CC6